MGYHGSYDGGHTSPTNAAGLHRMESDLGTHEETGLLNWEHGVLEVGYWDIERFLEKRAGFADYLEENGG